MASNAKKDDDSKSKKGGAKATVKRSASKASNEAAPRKSRSRKTNASSKKTEDIVNATDSEGNDSGNTKPTSKKRKKSVKEGTGTSRSKQKEAAAASAKPLSRNFLIEIGDAVREAVRPYVQSAKGRELVGSPSKSEAPFELEKVAEKALLAYLRNAKAPVAYYSEEAGYTTFTSAQPQNLLLIDPVDGTRAAKSGFESCVVSIASTRTIEQPTFADLDNACVTEIMGDRVFYAEKGKGARIYINGKYKKPKLSKNTDLELVSWSMTVPGRPAELIFPTAAKLIDLTSLKGGFFACNSTAFSLTRLITNQLDACVDFANRYLRDISDAVEDQFINAGRGMIMGTVPYDFAAALMIVLEAGGQVTDAYGKGFDDMPLLDSSVVNQHSIIAASNAELHNKLFKFFDTRIRQVEKLWLRRASLNGDNS